MTVKSNNSDSALDEILGYSTYPVEIDDHNRSDICINKGSQLSTFQNHTLEEDGVSSEIFQNNTDIISVSECLRRHSGNVSVKGTINSYSSLYKMIKSVILECKDCGIRQTTNYPDPINFFSQNLQDDDKPHSMRKCNSCDGKIVKSEYGYVNAVTIEIQDSETFNDLEKISCVLFDENTKDIQIGSNVIVEGKIKIISQKNKKSFPCLYSTSIQYENKEKLELTKSDIVAIQRITKKEGNNMIKLLTKMFAPSVIGMDIVKQGLLLSAVSTGHDDTAANDYEEFINEENTVYKSNYNNKNNDFEGRNRIHVLLVSNPGNGKSKIIRESTKLVSNSRYESSQHSSGKSLTAIVSKENDSDYCLRLGPIPLARGSLCVLNEVGRISTEEQGYLLDVMEEGEFTINKYGINAKIRSPTTIIASANPIGSTFKGHGLISNEDNNGNERIDINQLPLIKPVIDRFDLIFVIRDLKNENELRDYANRKVDKMGKKIPDYYTYLKKHILFARKINPVITDEARLLITEYFVNLMKPDSNIGDKNNNNPQWFSKRVLETIFRIVKSFSKLKLKDRVDVEDAKEAIEFFNAVVFQFTTSVASIPSDPKNIAIEVFISILKNSSNFSYSLEELAKSACESNPYVKSYLLNGQNNGNFRSLRIGHNRKLRGIYDMLLENPKIIRVSEKPIILQWVEDNACSSSYSSPLPSNSTSESCSSSGVYDTYDVCDINKNDKKKTANISEKQDNGLSHTSNTSYVQQISDSDSNPPVLHATSLVGITKKPTESEISNDIAEESDENKSQETNSKPIEISNSLPSDRPELLKNNPEIGFKDPFYFCKQHPFIENIHIEEIIDHRKFSKLHTKNEEHMMKKVKSNEGYDNSNG
ncbi:MAG: AAA family ATPase [Candidatus Nitrosocosmicus sp.]